MAAPIGSGSDSSPPRRSTLSLAIERFTTATFTSRRLSAAESLGVKNANNPQPQISAHEPIQKRSRKLSTRLSQRPFWTRRNTTSISTSVPVIPPSGSPHDRMCESTATIVVQKLMAPLNPPIPRSKTLDVLPRQEPNSSPSYASPTTSSLAKRTERVVSHERKQLRSKTPTADSSTMMTSRHTIRTNRTSSVKKDSQDITPSPSSLRVTSPSQANNIQLRVSRSRKHLQHRTPTPGPSKTMKSYSASRKQHEKPSQGKNAPDEGVVSGKSSTYAISKPDLGRKSPIIHEHLTPDQSELSNMSVPPIPSDLYRHDSTSVWKRNSFQPLDMSDRTPNPSNMCRLLRTPTNRNQSPSDAGSPKTPTKRYLLEKCMLQTNPGRGISESLTPTALGERSSTTLQDSEYPLSPKTLKTLADLKERRKTSGNSSPSYREPATLHNSWSPYGSKFGSPNSEQEAKKSLQRRGISTSPVTPTKALKRYFVAQMNAIPGRSTDSLPGRVGSSPTPKNPRLIHTALDSQTWSGRVTGLSDRLCSEELNAPTSRVTPSGSLHSSQTRLSHPVIGMMHDDQMRHQCVFNQLHDLCTTAEAKESLAKYQQQFWKKFGLEKLRERGEMPPATPKMEGMSKEEVPFRQVAEGKMAMKDKMRQKFKRESGSFGLLG